MAVHGKQSHFKLDNSGGSLTDLTARCDSVDFPQEVQAVETTVFSNSSRTYIAGLRGATISFSGPWDATIDAHLSGIYGSTATQTFEYSPESTTTGYRVYTGESFVTSFNKNSPVGDKVSYTCTLQVTGAVTATVH